MFHFCNDCCSCETIGTFLVNLLKFLIDIPYYTYVIISAWVTSCVQGCTRRRKNLDHETILVTGAASGLGQLLTCKLAENFPKAVLVLWDINRDGLLETKEKCGLLGATKVYTYEVDLADYEGVVRTASKVRNEVGHVTVLINNAGFSPYKLFLEGDASTEEKVVRVNLLSHMWILREFLPEMIARGRGHVVSTCSGLAFHRASYLSTYVASKYGLRGFLESVKVELEMHPDKPQIPFSVIYPGWVKTPMTEGIVWEPRYRNVNMFQHMEPEYVAGQMLRGILREEEEIVIPGCISQLTLLNRCLPSRTINRLERYVFRNFAYQRKEHTTQIV